MAVVLQPFRLHQGRYHSLILEADALFFRGPPLHKLDLSLQLSFLRLYVPKRAPLSCYRVRLALQLLYFGEGDRHTGGWLQL